MNAISCCPFISSYFFREDIDTGQRGLRDVSPHEYACRVFILLEYVPLQLMKGLNEWLKDDVR